MRRYGWVWLCVAGLALAGAAFSMGRMAASGGEAKEAPFRLRIEEPTEEERALQEIKVAASGYDLAESAMSQDGWVVRVEHETEAIEPKRMFSEAKKFFANLDRSRVPVAEASFLAKSNALRDIWGNRLSEVPLLRLGFDGATFARVNWQGVSPDNLTEIASDVWMHDLLLAKLREEASQPQGGQGGQQGGGQQSQGGGDGSGGNQ